MNITFFSPDKESGVRSAIAGTRPADSSEAKVVDICRKEGKLGDELLLCAYEKLQGAYKVEYEVKTDGDEKDTNEKEEKPRRGRPRAEQPSA